MKNFMSLLLCLMLVLTISGCGSKELSSATISRDDARVGGSLSFVYDKENKKIFVGGEGEVVQFSSADESKNLSEGTRVGLKIVAPSEVTNVGTTTLEMNGVNYSSGDFLESVNGEKQNFFYLYPLVSKEDNEVKFTICWQDGTKKQEYKLVVIEGTKFMEKDGKIS
ncbi:MAG: hypothetical protein E7375_01605 [Clostridiales bacterium]|nr:hypothetical protein [Clostridiales bacterium]